MIPRINRPLSRNDRPTTLDPVELLRRPSYHPVVFTTVATLNYTHRRELAELGRCKKMEFPLISSRLFPMRRVYSKT